MLADFGINQTEARVEPALDAARQGCHAETLFRSPHEGSKIGGGFCNLGKTKMLATESTIREANNHSKQTPQLGVILGVVLFTNSQIDVVC